MLRFERVTSARQVRDRAGERARLRPRSRARAAISACMSRLDGGPAGLDLALRGVDGGQDVAGRVDQGVPDGCSSCLSACTCWVRRCRSSSCHHRHGLAGSCRRHGAVTFSHLERRSRGLLRGTETHSQTTASRASALQSQKNGRAGGTPGSQRVHRSGRTRRGTGARARRTVICALPCRRVSPGSSLRHAAARAMTTGSLLLGTRRSAEHASFRSWPRDRLCRTRPGALLSLRSRHPFALGQQSCSRCLT